jgi:hypothetical protein
MVDIALHPHLDYELFPENSAANLEKLAAIDRWRCVYRVHLDYTKRRNLNRG